jgi:hypothetical protein
MYLYLYMVNVFWSYQWTKFSENCLYVNDLFDLSENVYF